MLKTIQKHGRPLQVIVPAEEAVALSRELDPSGLCLLVEGDLGPEEMQSLYTEICKPSSSNGMKKKPKSQQHKSS